MKSLYDIAIIGGGLIGSSAAYFLTQQKNKGEIILITQDPSHERASTYLYAGGSVQYERWQEPVKLEMTTVTAAFIKSLSQNSIDLSLIEDDYLYLDEGVTASSLNISGAKLVQYFIDKAVENGLVLKNKTVVREIQKKSEQYVISTDSGEFMANKVLLAVGPNTHTFMLNTPVQFEKRILFVLDMPITDQRKKLPHTIIPIDNGWAYFFLKKIEGSYKLLVGQEDLFEHSSAWKEENYFRELLDLGLGKAAPFLKDAQVEKVLWGFDAKDKKLNIYTEDNKFFSVNCGSAVRSCVWIGQKIQAMMQS